MSRNQTLRDLRGKRRLSDVASATGFSAGHISKAERNVRSPGKRLEAALRRFYRVSAERFDQAHRATLRQYPNGGRP